MRVSTGWFAEIRQGTYDFTRSQDTAAAFLALSQSELLDFFDEFVHKGAPRRSKLTVGVCSAAHAESLDMEAAAAAAASGEEEGSFVLVEDPDGLKRSHSLWPDRA